MLTAPPSTMTIAHTEAKIGRFIKNSANILCGTPKGSRAPREELGRAGLVLPHANCHGTPKGSRAPREELGRAELVLPHANCHPPSFEGPAAGRGATRAPGRSFCTPAATMRSPACS